MKLRFKTCAIIGFLFLYSGCAIKPQIIEADKSESYFKNALYKGEEIYRNNTIEGKRYRAFYQAATGYEPVELAQSNVYLQADRFCDSINKHKKIAVEHISEPPHILGNFPRAEIEFVCLDRQENNKYESIKDLIATNVGALNNKKFNDDINANEDINQKLKNYRIVNNDVKKWLIVIGIENYTETDGVKFAKNSSEIFTKVAQKTLGISDRNTYSFIDEKATSGAIKDKLEIMMTNIKEGDTIYFYYSGHGIPVLPDNEPYILPQDKMPEMIGKDEFFKLRNIYKMLSESKASKVVAIIDSCFSGATDGVSVVKGVAATRLKPKKVTFDTNKMIVMTAGQDKQYSNMYEEKGHRLFTYFVMKSLLKGKHNSEDIYREVYTNVKDESFKMGDMKVQEPQLEGNNKIDF